MPVLVALLAVLSTALGGIFALRHRDQLHHILGFTAGVILGVVLFAAGSSGGWPVADGRRVVQAVLGVDSNLARVRGSVAVGAILPNSTVSGGGTGFPARPDAGRAGKPVPRRPPDLRYDAICASPPEVYR